VPYSIDLISQDVERRDEIIRILFYFSDAKKLDEVTWNDITVKIAASATNDITRAHSDVLFGIVDFVRPSFK
jgi:hypothetical protein